MIWLADYAMPMQILHRELHGTKPLLYDFLERLLKFIKENIQDIYNDYISEVLLWIAKNHPEVLNDESNALSDISVKCLFFRDSWENMDEPLPTESLTTLLNSRVCRNLERFCGYIDSLDPMMHFYNLIDIRLALGMHNASSLIKEINCLQPEQHNFMSNGITINLKCGELDLNDHFPMSKYISSVFISKTSDEYIAWVVQATHKFLSNASSDLPFRDLVLINSEITAAGIVAIAKGLGETDTDIDNIQCQSPYINEAAEIPGYGNFSDFNEMMENNFDINVTVINAEEEINVFDY